ncbi:MAG: hypothetical protein ACLQHF_13815 [Terracidiphilus sp.]
MRVVLAASLFALVYTPLSAQTPSPAGGAPGSRTYSNPLGFSYDLPADWEVVDSQPSLPQVKEKATREVSSEEEKKGVACTQIGLTARHGNPASVILVETLPYDCFGQQMTENDLPGFGAGVAEGLKQSFDLGDPQVVSYTLGSHRLWAERVHGNPKGQPDGHYTIEISCALLRKAAVCWMMMAADSTSLAIFENGSLALEGDSPTPLVPAATFMQ